MKKLLKILITAAIVITANACCRRAIRVNELYDNQFYFELNGQPVILEYTPALYDAQSLPAEIYSTDSTLFIRLNYYPKSNSTNLIDSRFAIWINIHHFHGPGIYHFDAFDSSDYFNRNTIIYSLFEGDNLYSTGGPDSYLRILEYNPEENFIRGIFEFTVENNYESRKITKGFFDWQMIYHF